MERLRLRSRLLWALLPVLALVGCKHVRTAGFDCQANTVTTCGGKRAEVEDLHEEAKRTCKSAEVVRCGEEVSGYVAMTHGNASTYGGSISYTGASVAKPVRGTCCVFVCN